LAAFSLPGAARDTRSTLKQLYTFLGDFRNFAAILPEDKVENFRHSGEQCSFTIRGITPMTVKLAEKQPYEKLVFTSEGLGKFNFRLTVQFSGDPDAKGSCSVTMDGDLNPFILSMAKKPLQSLVDTMGERLAGLEV
jgi:hypothetical protein